MKSIKLNITMPDTLLKTVDDYAQRNAMTRSGLLCLAVSQYIQAQEAMPSINNVFALMGSLAKRAAAGTAASPEYEKELAELTLAQENLKFKG